MTVSNKKPKKEGLRSDNPDPVDIHVGYRMRIRRNLLGLSQEQLGKALGLTFQQIQKYERGVNRMGASRLHQVAQILTVPVGYFFENLSSAEAMPADTTTGGNFAEGTLSSALGATASNENHADILHRRETLELVRAYYRIQDPKQRRKVYELVKAMAEEI